MLRPCSAMPKPMPAIRFRAVIRRPAIASPLTNFEAPSSEPRKPASSCSRLRLSLASSCVIAPTARSESMASCFPGIASRAKRAPTSAIRPAPLVMTRKLTMTRTANTTRPTKRLPPMMNMANPSITPPAAAVPVWPCSIISFVEETFRARRRTSDASRTEGKDEKSRGL